MKPGDIKHIAAAALARAEDVTRHWLPDGKRQGHEWVAKNPRRNDNSLGSFSINLDTGAWAEFAGTDKGGDLVALLAFIDDCAQGEAAKRLAVFLGLGDLRDGSRADAQPQAPSKKSKPKADGADADILITPIPARAPPPPAAHRDHGKASMVWTYRDIQGRPLFHVARFDPPGQRKQICPLSFWSSGWRWKALPEPRPLYGLDKIAASLSRPSVPVLVCEGEKAADAAAQLLPACPTTTAANGAQSPNKADWSSLNGRRVRIWPDHDEPGKRYAADVARLARVAGAVEVEVLDLTVLAVDPNTGAARELPAKWDAANAVAEGWTAERLAELDKAGRLFRPVAVPEETPATNGGSYRSRFELRDDGVYYLGFELNKRTDKYEPARPLWVCSPLKVTACTFDVNGENHGRLLEFVDVNGTPHRWAMPMNMLSGSGEELRSELLRQGLLISINAGARQRLGEYIQETIPARRARCVGQAGWASDACEAFVFPNRTLGEGVETVLFQSDNAEDSPYRDRGTLAEWWQHVAAPCVGNSRLVFAVSCAFAGPLLGMAGADGGGIHLRGASSVGKTTALRVAASVWGGRNYLKRWRSTDNGLEALAALHSDTLLVLDEIGQMEGRSVGEAAYMLESGRGKQRATQKGGARSVKTWRCLFLSTGEISLADHAAATGKRTHAGQEIRLFDIPADAGKEMGMFETLHGRDGGHDLSRELCERAERYYGSAGPTFILELIRHRREIPERLREITSSFQEGNLPRGAAGQGHRAAARFALIAAAGEMATDWNITGWPTGEAERAAQKCFAAWVSARGGSGNLEVTNLKRQVRQFFELHGESRFTVWGRAGDDRAPHTSARAGFVKHEYVTGETLKDNGNTPENLASTYYVLPEVFRSQVCEGFDHREAEKILLKCGWLNPGDDGRATRKERLPGFGKTVRCYVLPLTNLN